MHRLIGWILAGVLLWPHTAEAETTRKQQLLLGAGITAGTTVLHGVIWSLYADRQGALAPHFVPVAGPIIGFQELSSTPCEDSRHGCPVRGMLIIYDSLLIAGQLGGLVVMTAAAFRPPDAAVRSAPGVLTVRWRW
ncbi:MAG: hypothetical protein ACI8RZ_003807 [Myxococcota bacterium]|jgi:hypothetical protein